MPAPSDHLPATVALDSPILPDAAALAIIRINAHSAPDMNRTLEALRLPSLSVGAARLCDLLGIDRGLLIRWSATVLHITPHGGPLITRRLLEAFIMRGVTSEPPNADPRNRYPEAADIIEACALDALARAASPLATDAILRQRDLWRRGGPPAKPEVQRALGRLLDPPTAVLLGAPNIGKSTLANALARRAVSIVADEPGVTRDLVGADLELHGLALRLLDAPGLSPYSESPRDDIAAAARELALDAARSADLLILCADASAPYPDLAFLGLRSPIEPIRLALRSDLGTGPTSDVTLSVRQGQGVDRTARAIRERLVPDDALDSADLWRFHPALPPLPG